MVGGIPQTWKVEGENDLAKNLCTCNPQFVELRRSH
jgi:hypothetical protein